MRLLRAAGGIVWREMPVGPRIAVVHRARRGDWSLPKGKLGEGEGWQDAARREIAEETGCDVRLGRFAGGKLHFDRAEPKLVLYWHAHVVRELGLASSGEVDEVAWLSRREVLARLDHASDRRLLLLALGGRPGRAGRGGGSSPPALIGAEELRSLMMVDSRKAEKALPSVLGWITRAISPGTGSLEARRA